MHSNLAIVPPTHEVVSNDPLAQAAEDVILAMKALRDAYRRLHDTVKTDDTKQLCLREQANFYNDKYLLLASLKKEGLEVAQ